MADDKSEAVLYKPWNFGENFAVLWMIIYLPVIELPVDSLLGTELTCTSIDILGEMLQFYVLAIFLFPTSNSLYTTFIKIKSRRLA